MLNMQLDRLALVEDKELPCYSNEFDESYGEGERVNH